MHRLCTNADEIPVNFRSYVCRTTESLALPNRRPIDQEQPAWQPHPRGEGSFASNLSGEWAPAQFPCAQLTEDKIRRLLAARRVREQQLGNDLFADPAWDILLEALAAELGDKRNSALDLCAALPVPRTTALRWIRKLEDDGWFERDQCATGDRKQVLKLTSRGSQRLRYFFEAVGPSLLLV
jgi:DNA-binding MarR family transcriptional regulator